MRHTNVRCLHCQEQATQIFSYLCSAPSVVQFYLILARIIELAACNCMNVAFHTRIIAVPGSDLSFSETYHGAIHSTRLEVFRKD